MTVCKSWHTFLQGREELWKELYVLMTGAICKNPPQESWKSLFQKQYGIRRHLSFGNVTQFTLTVDGHFTTQQLVSSAQLSVLSRQGITHLDPLSGKKLSTAEKLPLSSFLSGNADQLVYRDFYPFKDKFRFQSPHTSITSCPNNRYMTTWSLGYKFCSFAIWDKTTHQALFAQYNVYKPCLQVFDDQVVFQNRKMEVEVWNIPERQHLATLRMPDEIHQVEDEKEPLLHDNRLFVTYKTGKKTHVFDAKLQIFLYTLKDSSRLFITKNYMLAWNERYKITLYPAKSNTPLFHLSIEYVMPQILPDEDLLFAVAKEAPSEIGLWDLNNKTKIGSFSGRQAPLNRILLGSNRLVGISTDHRVFVWDIKSGQLLAEQPFPRSFLSCSVEHNILSFTILVDTNTRLGLSPYELVVAFLDLKTGSKLGTLPDKFRPDAQVSFTDGMVAALCEDPNTTTCNRLQIYNPAIALYPKDSSKPQATATHRS